MESTVERFLKRFYAKSLPVTARIKKEKGITLMDLFQFLLMLVFTRILNIFVALQVTIAGADVLCGESAYLSPGVNRKRDCLRNGQALRWIKEGWPVTAGLLFEREVRLAVLWGAPAPEKGGSLVSCGNGELLSASWRL
jgi:hypothetical protein